LGLEKDDDEKKKVRVVLVPEAEEGEGLDPAEQNAVDYWKSKEEKWKDDPNKRIKVLEVKSIRDANEKLKAHMKEQGDNSELAELIVGGHGHYKRGQLVGSSQNIKDRAGYLNSATFKHLADGITLADSGKLKLEGCSQTETDSQLASIQNQTGWSVEAHQGETQRWKDSKTGEWYMTNSSTAIFDGKTKTVRKIHNIQGSYPNRSEKIKATETVTPYKFENSDWGVPKISYGAKGKPKSYPGVSKNNITLKKDKYTFKKQLFTWK
jgi:hypothetical protein